MHVVNVLTDTHKLSLFLSLTHTPCVEFLVVGEIELRNNLKLGCCYYCQKERVCLRVLKEVGFACV
jgi:hypothetical protein